MKKTYLEVRGDGRNRCTMCCQIIPKEIPRLKVYVPIKSPSYLYYHSGYKTVCGFCLLDVVKNLNKKKMSKAKNIWIQKRVIDKL